MAPRSSFRSGRGRAHRPTLVVGMVVLALVAACGDSATTTAESAAPTSSETTSSDATAAPTTTTVAPTTTLAPTTTTTTTAPTTTTLPPTTEAPTAADDLAEFFAAAEKLDAEIAAAADEFNAGFDPDAGTVELAVADTVRELSAVSVAELIPAGMDLDLETALLVVYTDLESRIAALDGATRHLDLQVEPPAIFDLDVALACLSNGSTSKARFTEDLAAAQALAESLPSQPSVAPDSTEAGILATRLEAIFLFNYGCDGCGGASYDEPLPVDWEAGTLGDGVEFEATFDGAEWDIRINAC